MGVIRTVTGDVSSHKIGNTQCHEHLFIREGLSGETNPSLCMESSIKALKELEMYKACDGRTIVDAQPLGCGRMPRLLEEVSHISGVHIIASTGFHKLIFYPKFHWIHEINEKKLASLFVGELTKGMYIHCDRTYPKTRIKPKSGMIKVAVDREGLTQVYREKHRAAIHASLETGAAIQCHMENIDSGQALIDFYEDQGYPLSRLILAHTDRKIENLDETLRLLERGIFVELDTIGRFKYHDTDTEINFISKLFEEGFSDKILLGLDTTRARLNTYGGEIGLCFIQEIFAKALLERGFSKQQIDKMLKENPQKALELS